MDLKEMKTAGAIKDPEKQAKEFFISTCLDPENSWIDNDDFSDTTLFIDASKGATASVVKNIFSQLNLKEIVYTNLDGHINENCGVADIEGLERIAEEDVLPQNAKFNSYTMLRSMFEKANSFKKDKAAGFKISGLVFDGDGDRCFRLDYDPREDVLLVSSGDSLGVHQAAFLIFQEDDLRTWQSDFL